MSLDRQEFPNLVEGHYKQTSDADPSYNCLAWAAGVSDEWWDPDPFGIWPDDLPRDDSLDTLVMLYEGKGFDLCADGSLETGYEKIAIYGRNGAYEHAALQLPNGNWTSTLGLGVDIEHSHPECVAGGLYGAVVHFMARHRKE